MADTYLPAAMLSACAGPASAHAHVVGALAPHLHWSQTATYRAAPPHEMFLRRYAHATVLGSVAACPLLVDPTHTAALGLLLLGPENHYPHHHHPAEEIYVPITPAHWSSGLDQPYQLLAPGTPLHHQSGQVHAVKATTTALLALYLWTGDTTSSAQLC